MTDTTDTTTDPAPEPDAIAELRREAAGYRTRLRETEAERDRLAEQVAGFRRAEVERIATTPADDLKHGLRSPDDLWRYTEDEVDAYLTEDGEVDPDKVRTTVATVLAERPYLSAVPAGPRPDPSQGATDHAGPRTNPNGWGDLLKDATASRSR
jgi:hypothetical protein